MVATIGVHCLVWVNTRLDSTRSRSLSIPTTVNVAIVVPCGTTGWGMQSITKKSFSEIETGLRLESSLGEYRQIYPNHTVL